MILSCFFFHHKSFNIMHSKHFNIHNIRKTLHPQQFEFCLLFGILKGKWTKSEQEQQQPPKHQQKPSNWNELHNCMLYGNKRKEEPKKRKTVCERGHTHTRTHARSRSMPDGAKIKTQSKCNDYNLWIDWLSSAQLSFIHCWHPSIAKRSDNINIAHFLEHSQSLAHSKVAWPWFASQNEHFQQCHFQCVRANVVNKMEWQKNQLKHTYAHRLELMLIEILVILYFAFWAPSYRTKQPEKKTHTHTSKWNHHSTILFV